MRKICPLLTIHFPPPPPIPEQLQEQGYLNTVGRRDKSLFVIMYLTQIDFPWLSCLIFPTFHPWNPIRSCFLSSCPLPINVLSVPGRWHVTSTRHRESENNSGWKWFLEVTWSGLCSDQGSPQSLWATFASFTTVMVQKKTLISDQNFPCCDLLSFFLTLQKAHNHTVSETEMGQPKEVKAAEGILPWGISSLGKPAMPHLRLIWRLGIHMPSPTSFPGSCLLFFFF